MREERERVVPLWKMRRRISLPGKSHFLGSRAVPPVYPAGSSIISILARVARRRLAGAPRHSDRRFYFRSARWDIFPRARRHFSAEHSRRSPSKDSSVSDPAGEPSLFRGKSSFRVHPTRMDLDPASSVSFSPRKSRAHTFLHPDNPTTRGLSSSLPEGSELTISRPRDVSLEILPATLAGTST